MFGTWSGEKLLIRRKGNLYVFKLWIKGATNGFTRPSRGGPKIFRTVCLRSASAGRGAYPGEQCLSDCLRQHDGTPRGRFPVSFCSNRELGLFYCLRIFQRNHKLSKNLLFSLMTRSGRRRTFAIVFLGRATPSMWSRKGCSAKSRPGQCTPIMKTCNLAMLPAAPFPPPRFELHCGACNYLRLSGPGRATSGCPI